MWTDAIDCFGNMQSTGSELRNLLTAKVTGNICMAPVLSPSRSLTPPKVVHMAGAACTAPVFPRSKYQTPLKIAHIAWAACKIPGRTTASPT